MFDPLELWRGVDDAVRREAGRPRPAPQPLPPRRAAPAAPQPMPPKRAPNRPIERPERLPEPV
ncbi:MAG: hypothetical protein J0I21_06890 [Alphaproteobacteria bacterium]|nr:hypothetical protein [Alphaproteobacteria bacterium]